MPSPKQREEARCDAVSSLGALRCDLEAGHSYPHVAETADFTVKWTPRIGDEIADERAILKDHAGPRETTPSLDASRSTPGGDERPFCESVHPDLKVACNSRQGHGGEHQAGPYRWGPGRRCRICCGFFEAEQPDQRECDPTGCPDRDGANRG